MSGEDQPGGSLPIEDDTTLSQGRRHDRRASPVIVIYDGACNRCHGLVGWLLRRRHRNRFRFLPYQTILGTSFGDRIQEQCGTSFDESIVVWKQGQLFNGSTAVLIILSELEFPLFVLSLLWIVPQRLRDKGYRWYARRRHGSFVATGEPQECPVLDGSSGSLILSSLRGVPLLLLDQRADGFITADWRHLIMVNYVVPPEILRPLLPHGLEFDYWQGELLMSLVAFSFLNTSFGGISARPYADFEEINLRFYVKERNSSAASRGVIFVRELVPYRLVALIARLWYGERYDYVHTESHISRARDQVSIGYQWGSRSRCGLSAVCIGEPQRPAPDSLEAFIVEHYVGYARGRRGGAIRYGVEHPSWRVWERPSVKVEGDPSMWYPPQFSPYFRRIHSVLVAEGSLVRVRRPE